MSFASDVKTELAKIKIDDCCKKALLSSLLQLAGEVSINSSGAHVTLKTMNNSIARLFISLVKEIYDLPINIIVTKHNLTKNDCFNVVVDDAKAIISDFELFNKDYAHYNKFTKNECCKKAYIRGAFLANGSVNDPKKSYHLEIKCRWSK